MVDTDLPHGPRRSSSGCWTCRLRRKKCDENHPVCDACSALHITCYYSRHKPEWMDGGAKQQEMAERLKREAKEKVHHRRGDRAVISNNISGQRFPISEVTIDQLIALPEKLPRDLTNPICDLSPTTTDIRNHLAKPCPDTPNAATWLQRGADCTLASKHGRENIPFGRSETILLMFYLDHLLPFLFPFYHPSPLQGGKAWVLEMMLSSPVVRQTALCQSSYFFSLAGGTPNYEVIWETVLAQTRDAFGVLRQSLQVINDSNITEHLHGAVRVMASVMQVQRFEIAVLSFNNCQAHLNAALTLFKLLLDIPGAVEPERPKSSFNAAISRLGLSSWTLPAYSVQVPSAEQAAFRFSSALLILDDIIASTVLQEQPGLYKLHGSLLGTIDDIEPPINLETVVGCQNWALIQIGEIAALDAWKQKCKRAGNLDIMELVHRATVIKESLEAHLTRLETNPVIISKDGSSLLDMFSLTDDYYQQSKTPANQSSLVTRVWAHAAFVYLFIVVSGWQPASVDVRYHVGRIVELLTCQISPPELLRTMVWPFCVAGCLAEPAQEAHLRGMALALQPPSVFGTVRKALQIMENVWRNRDAGDAASRDLATCFNGQGDLVLLV